MSLREYQLYRALGNNPAPRYGDQWPTHRARARRRRRARPNRATPGEGASR